MAFCDWCDKDHQALHKTTINGEELHLCSRCFECNKNHECITCGETVFSTLTIRGECSDCMQIRSADTERKRSEAMMGLGLSTITDLTKDVEFTESAYNKWMTFSQGNYTPGQFKSFRKAWIKAMVTKESKWTDEEFENNFEDIDKILNQHLSTVFRESSEFILQGKSKQKTGAVVLAQSGKVRLIRIKDKK